MKWNWMLLIDLGVPPECLCWWRTKVTMTELLLKPTRNHHSLVYMPQFKVLYKDVEGAIRGSLSFIIRTASRNFKMSQSNRWWERVTGRLNVGPFLFVIRWNVSLLAFGLLFLPCVFPLQLSSIVRNGPLPINTQCKIIFKKSKK